jgi:hypothetical protein
MMYRSQRPHTGLRITYDELLLKLNDACCWLEECGVSVSIGRVGHYRKILQELIRARGTGNWEPFEAKHPNVWNAIFEALEILRIHEGLKNCTNERLFSKVVKAAKGPVLFSENSLANGSGRDISLELLIAAKFASTGLPIDLDGDADLQVEIFGRELFVECKRLTSEKSINNRLKEGLNQLRGRYETAKYPPDARGILVLSVSKLYNEKFDIVCGDSISSIQAHAQLFIKNFIRKNSDFIEKYYRDERTIGAIILLDSPGEINGTFHPGHLVKVAVRKHLDEPDLILIDEITRIINASWP